MLFFCFYKIKIRLLFWLFSDDAQQRGKFFYVCTEIVFDRCDGLFLQFAQFDIRPNAALVQMDGIQITFVFIYHLNMNV